MSEDKDVGNINSGGQRSDDSVTPVKTKNPNRVAAGKKLAENNRLQKEHYNKMILEKMEKQKIDNEGDGITHTSTDETSYGIYYVIAAGFLFGVGYYYYDNYVKPTKKPTSHKHTKQVVSLTHIPVRSKKIDW